MYLPGKCLIDLSMCEVPCGEKTGFVTYVTAHLIICRRFEILAPSYNQSESRKFAERFGIKRLKLHLDVWNPCQGGAVLYCTMFTY